MAVINARDAQRLLTRVSSSGLSEADGRVAAEKFTRRLPAVETSRPCVVTWARPRAHVNYGQEDGTAATRANTHPPQRPARRCPTRHPVPDRLFEARASTRVVPTGIEPALSSKLGTQKGGQKRHTRGPQGSLPFRRIRRRRPGTSHEAARTTTKGMAPPDGPAAADDHPAASRGGG